MQCRNRKCNNNRKYNTLREVKAIKIHLLCKPQQFCTANYKNIHRLPLLNLCNQCDKMNYMVLILLHFRLLHFRLDGRNRK